MSDRTGHDSRTDGHGTHPGGGNVSNQPRLVLPCGGALDDLDESQALDLTIVELEFARDVSVLAARAYERVLEIVRSRSVMAKIGQ